MSEAIAQKKFSCPACGGEAQWNPGKKALVCPFCGTASPAQVELTAAGEEVISEHDLVTALRAIPDDATRLAGGEDLRQMPELPGDLGLRPGTGRTALRFLRLDALWCPTRKSKRPSARRACCP